MSNPEDPDSRSQTVNPTPLLFDACMVAECNMHCEYCRDSAWGFRQSKTHPDELTARIRRVATAVADILGVPVLKLSGYGEFFLLPTAVELASELSSRYKHVQLATNMVLVRQATLEGLAKIPNLSLCVSLDGHRPDLNRARTKEKVLHRVVDGIQAARDLGIPLEIYSTLTRYNTRQFPAFVRYVQERFPGVTCFPFPVRGHPELMDIGPEASAAMRPLVDHYDEFQTGLPPRQYLERLLVRIEKGARFWPCLVPFTNIAADPTGQLVACACGIRMPLGDFNRDPEGACEVRRTNPVFGQLRRLTPRCRDCFTHFDVFSALYSSNGPPSSWRPPWLRWEDTDNVLLNLRKAARIPAPGGVIRTVEELAKIAGLGESENSGNSA